ncbi:MAG: Ig-like domain-containing protein [Bacteroidetes bacterium]|nr:Ig-like domain-containing protein [Bacteroidota bacterium]
MAFLQRCANPVSPAGGPQDKTPPNFVKAEPEQFTKNFQQTRIRIYFDEFVELKDVNKQLIISPPMEKMPDIKSRGRSIQIDFTEPLMDSTTYTIFFGDAIVDITENNPISNFLYVFSTGDILDSLMLKGQILDAFTNEEVPDVSLMLYLDNNDTIPYDSLPYYVKPYFMTKTVSNGEFTFFNLPGKTFKIFALEDINTTLTFDQPSERIAFIDSLVNPYYSPPPVPDSLKTTNDTVAADTSNFSALKIPQPKHQPIEMYLFQETDSVQRFLKASLLKQQHLAFIFKNPVIDPEISVYDTLITSDWFIREDGINGDTIQYWITDLPADSLTFIIEDQREVLDTTRIAIKPTEKKRRNKKDEDEEEEIKKESIKVIFTKGAPAPDKPFVIRFPYPVAHADFSGTLMIEGEDTLETRFNFVDEIRRKAILEHPWKEATRYRFIIPDSVFTDIRGLSHDTLTPAFTTKSISDYGNFYVDVTLTSADVNHIFQLYAGDKKIREISTSESQRLTFEYLEPGPYLLKVIVDKNGNGKWDTGDYHYRIQPEKVQYFNKEITVRANWDVVEAWEL